MEKYPDYINYGGECPGVYYLRLLRDGWQCKSSREGGRYHDVTVFEKRINSDWVLRKFAHATISSPAGRGCYYDEHEMENLKTGAKLNGSAWEWAEVDRHRIVWADSGKLFAGCIEAKGMQNVVELYDFNKLQYERIQAPY